MTRKTVTAKHFKTSRWSIAVTVGASLLFSSAAAQDNAVPRPGQPPDLVLNCTFQSGSYEFSVWFSQRACLIGGPEVAVSCEITDSLIRIPWTRNGTNNFTHTINRVSGEYFYWGANGARDSGTCARVTPGARKF